MDGCSGFLRLPAHRATFFDDGLDHVRSKYTGALGDDLLTFWSFIKLNTNFRKAIGTALCPAVLEVVEADYFTFFEWKSHDWSFKF